jgi:hypothetical protein
MADMSDKEENDLMKRMLEDIFKSADDAMNEAGPNVGAKALMSFRWIKKLAKRGLGESDD